MNPQQHILVFDQDGSSARKIEGIDQYGRGRFRLEVFSVKGPLPTVIDDTSGYLPDRIRADLVLDFLRHPDLSHDLAALCDRQGVPLVASGKKSRGKCVITPPT